MAERGGHTQYCGPSAASWLTAAFKWVCANASHVAVSFDLFGTLVDAERVADPASAIGAELSARGVAVPADWEETYRRPHVDVPDGVEISLLTHVRAALASRDVTASTDCIRRVVRDAFVAPVHRRPDARRAITAASTCGPVGVLSNCSVPGLVERTLDAASIDPDTFDAVVTSVGCGWRKPDARAFEAVAAELGVPIESLTHVGDDPVADGGIADAGGTAICIQDTPLAEVPWVLGGREP